MLRVTTQHTTADGVAHTIGYIRLYEFNANSSVQMARAVEALEAEGADGSSLLNRLVAVQA